MLPQQPYDNPLDTTIDKPMAPPSRLIPTEIKLSYRPIELLSDKRKRDTFLDYLGSLSPSVQANMVCDTTGKYAFFLNVLLSESDPFWKEERNFWIDFWTILSPQAKQRLMHADSPDQKRFLKKFTTGLHETDWPINLLLLFWETFPQVCRQQLLYDKSFLENIANRVNEFTADAFVIAWPQLPMEIKEAMLRAGTLIHVLGFKRNRDKFLTMKNATHAYANHLFHLLHTEPRRYHHLLFHFSDGVTLAHQVGAFLEESPMHVFWSNLTPTLRNGLARRTSYKARLHDENGRRVSGDYTSLIHWTLQQASPSDFLYVWSLLNKSKKAAIGSSTSQDRPSLLEMGLFYLPMPELICWLKALDFNQERWEKELLFQNFRVLDTAICYCPDALYFFLEQLSLKQVSDWIDWNTNEEAGLLFNALEVYPDTKENTLTKKSNTATFIRFLPRDEIGSYVLRVDYIQGHDEFDEMGTEIFYGNPISWAAHRGDVATLAALQKESWFDDALKQRNRYGNKPIKIASEEGRLACVKFLAEHDKTFHYMNKYCLTAAINSGYRFGLTQVKPVIDYFLQLNVPLYVENEHKLIELNYYKDQDKNENQRWLRELGLLPQAPYHDKHKPLSMMERAKVEQPMDVVADSKIISLSEFRLSGISSLVYLLDWDTLFLGSAPSLDITDLQLRGGVNTLNHLQELRDNGFSLMLLVNHTHEMTRDYARCLNRTAAPGRQLSNIDEPILSLFDYLVSVTGIDAKQSMITAFAEAVKINGLPLNQHFLVDQSPRVCEHAKAYQIKPLPFTSISPTPSSPSRNEPSFLIVENRSDIEAEKRGIAPYLVLGALGVEAGVSSIVVYELIKRNVSIAASIGAGVILFFLLAGLTVYGYHRYSRMQHHTINLAEKRDAFFNQSLLNNPPNVAPNNEEIFTENPNHKNVI